MEWLTEGLMVTILGMCTVFVVLIFICIILAVMGYIMKNTESDKKPEKKKPVANASPVMKAENNVNSDMELIAAITAAVAAYESAAGNHVSPDKLVVRSFRRVNTWNREAIQEQQNNLF